MSVPSEKVKEMIAKFVLKNNYWGYLFSRVRRVYTPNLPAPAGVVPFPDGTIALCYRDDLLESPDDTILRVLEHEGMHILNKHISRLLKLLSIEFDEERKFMKRDIFQIASDCAINEQSNMPRILELGKERASFVLLFPDLFQLPPKKATEWYYNELLRQQNQKRKNQQGKDGSGGGSGNNQQQSGKGQGKIQGKSFSQMTDQEINDLLKNGIDDHSDWQKFIKDVADVNALARKIDTYSGNIIKESIKNFNKGRGYLPGYIQELIDQALRPPKAPYYEIIKKLVKGTRLAKWERAYTKINRKRVFVFSIDENEDVPVISPFPGKKRDFSFKIGLMMDTSGSMGQDDLLEALSGVKNFIENDRYCITTVVECDVVVQKEYTVKKIRDIDFKIKGRGGTVILPGLIRCKELNTDVTIVFTDGACDDINHVPRKFLPKRIIWVITPGGSPELVNKTGFVVRLKD
jgi:predicted metal-dependent peptidase